MVSTEKSENSPSLIGWVRRFCSSCANKLGNHKESEALVKGRQFYANHAHIMEGEVASNLAESKLHALQMRHEVVELWLCACEDSINHTEQSQRLALTSQSKFAEVTSVQPSRTSWQGFDPHRHANGTGGQRSVSGGLAFQKHHQGSGGT